MSIHVLMVTSEWPTEERPHAVPFIVRQVTFLRQAGVTVDVFHFRGRRNPVRYFKAWLALRRKMGSGAYHVVHAQWGQSALVTLPKRIPLVVTFRGSDLEGYVNERGRYTLISHLLRLISRWMARVADEVILVSDRLAGHIHQRPYHVIPSGLDLDLFRPMPKDEARQALGLPHDRTLILFAANPNNPIKRHQLAAEAVAALGGDVELLVTRGVRHEQMPLYMNAADALILTSTHEGSPNVIKEALACNLPIVSVDVGDVRQRLEGVLGAVVCVDDTVETLVEGLQEVLAWEGDFEGRTAVEPLSEHQTTERVISIYRGILE